MNYFMQYYAFPISTGLKAVSSSISLVGPAVTVTNACGVPHSNCDSGWGSWFLPISRYFLSTFDVISVHAYNADHGGVRDNLDKLNNTYIKYQRPIWLTETGFTQSQDPNGNILALYVDEYNRGAWWTKTFYHDLYDDNSTKYGLLDPNWNPRPAFYTYQTLYNH